MTFALTRPLAKAPTRQAIGASVSDVFAPKDVGPWYDSYGAVCVSRNDSRHHAVADTSRHSRPIAANEYIFLDGSVASRPQTLTTDPV